MWRLLTAFLRTPRLGKGSPGGHISAAQSGLSRKPNYIQVDSDRVVLGDPKAWCRWTSNDQRVGGADFREKRVADRSIRRLAEEADARVVVGEPVGLIAARVPEVA